MFIKYLLRSAFFLLIALPFAYSAIPQESNVVEPPALIEPSVPNSVQIIRENTYATPDSRRAFFARFGVSTTGEARILSGREESGRVRVTIEHAEGNRITIENLHDPAFQGMRIGSNGELILPGGSTVIRGRLQGLSGQRFSLSENGEVHRQLGLDRGDTINLIDSTLIVSSDRSVWRINAGQDEVRTSTVHQHGQYSIGFFGRHTISSGTGNEGTLLEVSGASYLRVNSYFPQGELLLSASQFNPVVITSLEGEQRRFTAHLIQEVTFIPRNTFASYSDASAACATICLVEEGRALDILARGNNRPIIQLTAHEGLQEVYAGYLPGGANIHIQDPGNALRFLTIHGFGQGTEGIVRYFGVAADGSSAHWELVNGQITSRQGIPYHLRIRALYDSFWARFPFVSPYQFNLYPSGKNRVIISPNGIIRRANCDEEGPNHCV